MARKLLLKYDQESPTDGIRAVLSIGIITQSDLLKTFIDGDTVDLKCFISGTGGDYYNWFKLTVGQAPAMIVSLYLDSKDPTLYGEFDNNPRFSAEKNGDSFVLTISNAKPSDVGMYYCAARDYDGMIFGNGIFLMHKELCLQCGEILFGNGIKLEIKDNYGDPLLLVYCLSSALGLSFILIIFLGYIMYKMNKGKCLQCRGPVSQTRGPAVSYSDTGAQDADNLHYVALNLSNKTNRSRRQRSNMEEETVYSGIKQ
eukprot:XP_014011518.1 PREDICTED: uncharacterized protein LOC106577718 [Salmo salar]